ncbi:MAG: alpha/beta fold hydrolase [Ideonella sp.]|nr:alpha/beta fold hydrolase [Ideonella sp.]
MGLSLHRLGIWAAWAALAAALSGCAWIDTQQRAKVYRPTPGSMADWKPVSAHDELLWLALPPVQASAEPQRLRAVWIAADDPAAPAVLYLHGTFRNLIFNQPKIAAIHAAGFSVLAVDYRGWGESSRLLPSEQSIMEDAERTWAEFTRRAPDAHSRVIFGHSMGSGVAIELALRYRDPLAYGALVIESGMTSMPDMVRDVSPLGFLALPLVTQQFDSIGKIGAIDAPKWFLSGGADKTVPPQHTQRLYDAARGNKQLEFFDGGSHSGLHREFEQRYQALWREVAASLAPRADARR